MCKRTNVHEFPRNDAHAPTVVPRGDSQETRGPPRAEIRAV